jgi:transcriptional regulator with XRE-family HTH domain
MAPPALARQKIDARGIDWVCEQLEDGRSQRDIAKELGVGTMSLNAWLHDNPVHSARVLASMQAGAEAFEAEAVRILTDTYDKLDTDQPHPHASSLATLARERAQAAWRQASVRDPRRYSDRRAVDTNITITHDTRQISTAELERLVMQQRDTLQLADDGTVEDMGGTSDS